jgi:MFS transporter, DHA2 family, methylenomycin A resistance protein
VGLLMNIGGGATILVTTLFLLESEHEAPLTAALWLVTATGPLVVVSVGAGFVAARFGSRPVMTVGMTTAAVGSLLLFLAEDRSGPMALVPAFVLIGAGLALNTAPMVAAVQAAAPSGSQGTAAAVNNTARQIGSAVGVAALGLLPGVAPGSTTQLHVVAIGAAIVWIAAAGVAHRRLAAA